MAEPDADILLPEPALRLLGDRSYEKRKTGALSVEEKIKALLAAKNSAHIKAVIKLLGEKYTRSNNQIHRKGGLIGLAATAIGLASHITPYLPYLLDPVTQCFSDPEPRVRYYACESLFNIAKVARQAILKHSFNEIFAGLCELYSDVDVDVKNAAQLLDRLLKEIVTESDHFAIDEFIPLLERKLEITNPYIRQLLVGWITILDSVPFINMLDYLPSFLKGLFTMLSDVIKEIRQQADQALCEFLEEIKRSGIQTPQLAPIIEILVSQCAPRQLRFNKLTAVTWLQEIIKLGQHRLQDLYGMILNAVLQLVADSEREIRDSATDTNNDLLQLVRKTPEPLDFSVLLHMLRKELQSKDPIVRQQSLSWLAMLLEKNEGQVLNMLEEFWPVLINLLCDEFDSIAMSTLQVLAGIASNRQHFDDVLRRILSLFQKKPELLEDRGSFIIRTLCAESSGLDSKTIYITMAKLLLEHQDVNFARVMVQTFNLILLTAVELRGLRAMLERCFVHHDGASGTAVVGVKTSIDELFKPADTESYDVFKTLYVTWCHNPVAALSLCLLAQAYHLSALLIPKFCSISISLDILMQLDRLVMLIESPIFLRQRLQLIEPRLPQNQLLIQTLYGVLMLLPQSNAFNTLNERLKSISPLYLMLNQIESPLSRGRANSSIPDYIKELGDRFSALHELH